MMIIRVITINSKGYKIYFENGKLLILNFEDDYFQGYSAWHDFWGINDLDIEAGHILGEKIINYHQLSSHHSYHDETFPST